MLWYIDDKLREFLFLRFNANLPAMLLHDDVVADRQAQARALSRWFRRKERIENFLADADFCFCNEEPIQLLRLAFETKLLYGCNN